MKKAIFDLIRLWRDMLSFNVEQFQAALFHSAITDIFDSTANPVGRERAVEIVSLVDQLMADIEIDLRPMEKPSNIIEKECDDDRQQSGDGHKDSPVVRRTQKRPPNESDN